MKGKGKDIHAKVMNETIETEVKVVIFVIWKGTAQVVQRLHAG